MLLSSWMAQDSATQQRMVSAEARKPCGGAAHAVPQRQGCGRPQHVLPDDVESTRWKLDLSSWRFLPLPSPSFTDSPGIFLKSGLPILSPLFRL